MAAVPVPPAPLTPPASAPPGRALYVSFSGTERTDWQKQALIYGGGIFVLGLVVGSVLAGRKRESYAAPLYRGTYRPRWRRDMEEE